MASRLLWGHGHFLRHGIYHLAADHTLYPSRTCQLVNTAQNSFRRKAAAEIGGGHCRKSVGQQGIPGQKSDAFPKLNMAGGLAAAQIIIIHAGQVIVDERIGMNHLYGTGQWQSSFHIATAQAHTSPG